MKTTKEFCHCHCPTCGKNLTCKTRLAHYHRTQATLYNPPNPVTPLVASAWPVAILNVPTAPPRTSNHKCVVVRRAYRLWNGQPIS
ncbi:hypothetical protein K443DRAFT_516032 [Laccaria amethystina LaAM-08-1]|uniref:Uncharacterized protein n=1 Tax=Laccaria amethystina LaAM-08-1 TaxID=1095629 RepID=A0A0C9XCI5_9AGAR|nr:hypothetical protein K443DRAFT_516032 [Laccaria amethystina LaAM-08-1]